MKKILIIEDNHDIRENICELLELSGYETCQAPNGLKGIESAQQNHPDLIICDIMMPEMDGYGVLSTLNKSLLTTGIPFIFLTAKAEKSDFRKGLSMGADDYITKPFTDDELLHAVKMRLQKVDTFRSIISQHADAQSVELDSQSANFEALLNFEEREVRDYKRKEFVYHEGNRASYLFYVKKGAVKTFKIHDEGKEFITEIYNQGSYFGYYPLLKDTNYQDYAECIESSELILIPKADFLQLIYNNIEIARQFIKSLTNDILDKEDQLIHMAYDSLRQRVIRTLCELHEKFKDAENISKITLTREEISKYIGTARESFIRIMSELKDKGAIEIINGDIVISNIKKLETVV
ncbi:MAG TPA: response regulator [Chitinophagales bacterium]|nr:response regulator [Chitinophagales bacterium]